jgi:L-asparaginase II
VSAAALLAEVWRGDVCEVAVRGHIAVVDSDNRLLAFAGDPDARTTLRSTVKPLQALPFVDGGAADALGASVAELAIACASHDGEPRHVETVRTLLGRVGLDESALSCGPQWPYSESAARALVAAGETAGRVHNNCSGKHAAMLCACVHAGWPVEGYAAYDHPLQRDIRRRMSNLAGIRLADTPHGIDGCGLPTHGVTLRYLGRMFAAASAAGGAFARCQDAMAAEPYMVGGEGRFDTLLLSWAGQSLTAKSGGAAVWAGVARGGGPGVAIKLEGGVGSYIAPVALAALRSLQMLPSSSLPADLAALGDGVLHNWAGDVVGATRMCVELQRT